MNWSGFLKIVLGVLLAISLVAGGGALAARFLIARFSAPPPKPMFPNDKPTTAKSTVTKAAASKSADTAKSAADTASPSPKPLPSGAYQARVTQSIGLILRDAPGGEGAQIGGVDYNDRVIVLETSSDGSWQKIRLGNDREGWVKAGNVEQLNQ